MTGVQQRALQLGEETPQPLFLGHCDSRAIFTSTVNGLYYHDLSRHQTVICLYRDNVFRECVCGLYVVALTIRGEFVAINARIVKF